MPLEGLSVTPVTDSAALVEALVTVMLAGLIARRIDARGFVGEDQDDFFRRLARGISRWRPRSCTVRRVAVGVVGMDGSVEARRRASRTPCGFQ